MKTMILILSILLLTTGCSEDETVQQENSILGTWQLIETKFNDANGAGRWEPFEIGRIIIFNQDLSYESEIYPTDCGGINSSTYRIQNESEINVVEITITCVNPNMVFESTDSFSFDENSNLILIPIEPECPEGCAFKYEKVE